MLSSDVAITKVQSLGVVQNMVHLAIATVAYSRGLCQPHCFEDANMMDLKMVKMVPSTAESKMLLEWTSSAFEALRFGYLRELSLCIYKDNCQDILESYMFHFGYAPNGEGAQVTVSGRGPGTCPTPDPSHIVVKRSSKQEVVRTLVNMIQSIHSLIKEFPPIVGSSVVAMRLGYFEEKTPADYEPPGYSAANSRVFHLFRKEQHYSPAAFGLLTAYHGVRMSIFHPVIQTVQGAYQSRPSCTQEEKEDITLPATSSMYQRCTISQPSEAAEMRRTDDHNGGSSISRQQLGGSDRHPPSVLPAQQRCADPSFSPQLLQTISTLEELADSKGDLWQYQVAHLLVAIRVFQSSASLVGGRGFVTQEEVQQFLREDCPLDLPLDFVAQSLTQLVKEGYLSPAGPAASVKKTKEVKRWRVVAVLKPSSLEKLLRHQELRSLLKVSTLTSLEAHLHPTNTSAQAKKPLSTNRQKRRRSLVLA